MSNAESATDGMEDRSPTARVNGGHSHPDELGSPRCLVIMYHYVHGRTRGAAGTADFTLRGFDASPGVCGLTSRDFQLQLDRLCALMEPIDWPTMYAWRNGRGSIPDRCFLLTFDDGLADHAATVLPILERRSLRGVFFIPGVILSAQRMLSAHAIHLLLSTLDERTFERELISYLATHGDGRTDWLASVDMAAARALYHYESPLRARLKYLLTFTLPIDLRVAAVDALFDRHVGSPARWAEHWYLGWDDLIKMRSAGHTIGGHSFGHEPYNRLTPAERREDMRQVAAILRNGLGPGIHPFSYPYGRFDDDACRDCRDAGFAQAFTTDSRWVTKHSDLFQLPRVDAANVDAVIREEVACSPAHS